MKKLSRFLALSLLLSGCAGGPTHDYYSPSLAGSSAPKFKGQITFDLVDDVEVAKAQCVNDGYTLIGTSNYRGKYPEAVELRAQAKRCHANRVVYSCRHAAGQEGMRFWIGRRAPWEPNPLAEQFEVRIAFLGK